MSDAIGAMRARVTLKRPTRVADEIGGAALMWVNAGDAWAEISAGVANEGAGYDGAPSVTGFTVRITRRDDVRARWRVAWGARVLRVIGVRDDGEARIDLICEEVIL
ncbi:MAG: head-tail adaptor protein [Proteobacteria bacterium]|nr:head-tail adaptor protein [Pseudomonadota bacterium]